MTSENVKATFVTAHDEDYDEMVRDLATRIAQQGAASEKVSEILEAEESLNLAMSRYWDLISESCTSDFVDTFKSTMAGDYQPSFGNPFSVLLELVKLYDDITLELQPQRQLSVAISELRERLQVASHALALAQKVPGDPVEDLEAWSKAWLAHVKVHNLRPNAEFVFRDAKVQQLLEALRNVSMVNLIKHFYDSNFDLKYDPTQALISKATALRGQVPEIVGPILERASVLNRIKDVVRDKAVGKTPGPCEITALLADAAILKDCCSVDVVASSLNELNNMWQAAFDTWAASAD